MDGIKELEKNISAYFDDIEDSIDIVKAVIMGLERDNIRLLKQLKENKEYYRQHISDVVYQRDELQWMYRLV